MEVMEEYRGKLEKLPVEKLNKLVERYKTTITKLEDRHMEARQASMMAVVDYVEKELVKKREELAQIEQIITEREN